MKALAALASPTTLLLLLLLVAVAGLWLPWPGLRAAARMLLTLLALGWLLLALFPLERLYLSPLERRFPAAGLPERIDGILVLGGGVSVGREGGQTAYRLTAISLARTLAAADLARRHPEARVLLTGGLGAWRQEGPSEAALMAEILTTLGLPCERLLLEEESRTTWENARYAASLAPPQPEETWVLVTSAFHMPRALGAFRAAGWSPLAYPVAPQAGGRGWLDFRVRPLGSLQWLELAGHEWLGLVAYRLAGRSSALFPAP